MRKNIYIIWIVIILIIIAIVLFRVSKLNIPPHTTVQGNVTYVSSSPDTISVDLPFPGAVTGKSFSVIGKARGNWFFEGSFPVEVFDANNKSIATGVAHAQSDWMTDKFVSFQADIVVPPSYIGPATLVLKKDNPSGLPINDSSISFPITIEY